MRNVTIRQLQMFVEAADQASFARAAEALYVSPAAVSFQIKQIEEMSGFALFERVGRQVSLTAAGAAFIGHARSILRSLADADRALTNLRGVVGGQVTLGAVSTAKYIVPHVLARFQAQCPGVSIELRFGNREQITTALARGELDLAVMGRPEEGADIVAVEFAAHPSVMIAPPSHRLAGAGTLVLADLAGEPLIAREEGSGTRNLMEQVCAAAGVRLRVGMTASSNETIKQAVMAGMGVAMISRHTIGLELALGLLHVLPVEGFPQVRAWFVAQRRSMPLMPAHAALRAFLVENGEAVISEMEHSYRRARGAGADGDVARS